MNVKTVEALKAAGKTVAVAESCTGGLLAASITDVPGASEVFSCGMVTYANEIKINCLHVAPETIDTFGVVSAEVAKAMARSIRQIAGADYGIGITGVAGPGPDGTHPEGDIYIALATATEDKLTHLLTGTHNQREANRHAAVAAALNLLLKEVTDNG